MSSLFSSITLITLLLIIKPFRGECVFTSNNTELLPGECAGPMERTSALRTVVKQVNLGCSISLIV